MMGRKSFVFLTLRKPPWKQRPKTTRSRDGFMVLLSFSRLLAHKVILVLQNETVLKTLWGFLVV